MKTIFRLFIEAIFIVFLLIFFDIPSRLGYTSSDVSIESVVDDCKDYLSDGMNRVTDFYDDYGSDVVEDCKEYLSDGATRVKKICSESTPKIIEEVKEHRIQNVTSVNETCSEIISDAKKEVSNLINNIENEIVTIDGEWILVANEVEATVYNAVPSQCDDDPTYTASMFRLDLNDVYSHKIIAMERTFMKKLGLKYGDVVKVEGTGRWDGIWQIQDTMSTRFAGQKKIDFLVPQHVYRGKWNDVKIYSLLNKEETDIYKCNMAPQATEI